MLFFIAICLALLGLIFWLWRYQDREFINEPPTSDTLTVTLMSIGCIFLSVVLIGMCGFTAPSALKQGEFATGWTFFTITGIFTVTLGESILRLFRINRRVHQLRLIRAQIH